MSKGFGELNRVRKSLLEGKKSANVLKKETEMPMATLNRRLQELLGMGAIKVELNPHNLKVPLYYLTDRNETHEYLLQSGLGLELQQTKYPISFDYEDHGITCAVRMKTGINDPKVNAEIRKECEKNVKEYMKKHSEVLPMLASKHKVKEIMVAIKMVV